jgi:hypothetical protein
VIAAGDPFEVVIGMKEMLVAVAAAGMTVAVNRQALETWPLTPR